MKNFKNFKQSIKGVQNIIITTHIHPDADGLGSQIALAHALKSIGKTVYCVNQESVDKRYKYLDKENVLLSYKEYSKIPNKELDLLIIVDTNSLARIGRQIQELVMHSKNILFIDHHPCPREMQAIHCIDTKKAATGELVADLIYDMKIPMDKNMALGLYTAIIIDTSSFRYPTVSPNTHKVIARLLETGIKAPEAFNLINGTKKVGHMKLLGEVLTHIKTNKKETIAWISLTEKQIKKHKSDPEDTHGFINHLLILDKIKVACMFRQVDKYVKVSFRTADTNIDVGIMAQALGGGGHNHASATMLEGNLEEIIPKTINKLSLMLEN